MKEEGHRQTNGWRWNTSQTRGPVGLHMYTQRHSPEKRDTDRRAKDTFKAGMSKAKDRHIHKTQKRLQVDRSITRNIDRRPKIKHETDKGIIKTDARPKET